MCVCVCVCVCACVDGKCVCACVDGKCVCACVDGEGVCVCMRARAHVHGSIPGIDEAMSSALSYEAGTGVCKGGGQCEYVRVVVVVVVVVW